ncbi:MAG: TIGR02710 family CRISPR-associated protein, partial [Thermodesulfobacteria bacterium]|nr:TIGR02710 family CRISPR-associated protein [Thermodesulfobacteriota bacterium]
MKKVLILTVGGSCDPLVNAIKNHQPDFVYFVCSKDSRQVVDGPGKPCKRGDEGLPSIVAQTGLPPERFRIVELSDPDELGLCYREIISTIKKDLSERFADEPLEIVANYTGGTKTMSVALSLAGLNADWDLEFNRGPRTDLVKIRGGDVPVLMDRWQVYACQQLKTIDGFWSRFYYAEAMELASSMLKHPLSPELKALFQTVYTCSKAFDAWDRFHHREAYELLQSFGKDFGRYVQVLSWLARRETPYLLVSDIVRNAERRAAQKRFDDAVARLYRAVELLAQARIETKYGLQTGKFPFARLPEEMKKSLSGAVDEKGNVSLALRRSYEFLAAERDPLGELFKQQENKVLNALKKRNYSILAHGTEPIDEDVYREVSDVLLNFLAKGLELVQEKK